MKIPTYLLFLFLICPALVLSQATSVQLKILNSPRKGTVRLYRLDMERYDHTLLKEMSSGTGDTYHFTLQQKLSDIYRLTLPDGKRIRTALIPGQKLELVYDYKTEKLEIEGSNDTRELQLAINKTRELARSHVIEAQDRYKEAVKSKDEESKKSAELKLRQAKGVWLNGILDHMNQMQSAIAAYGVFTRFDWNYQVGDYDLERMKKVVRRFELNLPDDNGTHLLRNKVSRYASTDIGAVLPDISLRNPDGDIMKVSDLRGNYVLVEIWASWCVPCRKESPNIRKNYDLYNQKGFRVFSISFDSDKDKWLKAIRKDQLNWPHHVSDLQGWNSLATSDYATAPPANFLLDPEGRIIGKNLTGLLLDEALAAVMTP